MTCVRRWKPLSEPRKSAIETVTDGSSAGRNCRPPTPKRTLERSHKMYLKKASPDIIKNIVGYALVSKRDLSAVGDVAAEVRAMLGTDDLSKATVGHVHRAIYDHLIPSDETFLEGMKAARNTGRKSQRKPLPTLPEEPAPEPAGEEILPARPRENLTVPGSRVRAVREASLVEA